MKGDHCVRCFRDERFTLLKNYEGKYFCKGCYLLWFSLHVMMDDPNLVVVS